MTNIQLTMKRKMIVAGNWKMNLDLVQANKLASALSKQVSSSRHLEVLVCPPALYIQPLVDQFRQENCDIAVGAQNCHDESSGAYTGEIAASMIASTGAKYTLVGHSERRAYYGEDEALFQKKIDQALTAGLHVIYCVGETLEQRESGQAFAVVEQQVRDGLAKVSEDHTLYVTIAYEPVWAIGTGKTATPAQAQEIHHAIRGVVAAMYDDHIANRMSILYGGSVKPANAQEIFSQSDVDGGLVGGASLDEHQFIAIVRAAQSNL